MLTGWPKGWSNYIAVEESINEALIQKMNVVSVEAATALVFVAYVCMNGI